MSAAPARHRVVRAMLWEIWAGNRPALVSVAAILPVCALGTLCVKDPGLREFAGLLAYVPMSFALLALFSVFNFTEPSGRLKTAVFPERLFALPVRTGVLVGVPMGAGALTVGAFYLAWVQFVFRSLGREVPMVLPALVLVTGLVCCQAVMWGLARFQLLRLFVCGALGGLLIWVLVLPEMFLPQTLIEAGAGLPVWWGLGGFLVASSAAIGVAWASVNRQRHVRTMGVAPGRRTAAEGAALGRARTPFANAKRAQFWLEWRRNGLMLPLSMGIFVLVLAVGAPWFLQLGPDPTDHMTVGNAESMRASPVTLVKSDPRANVILWSVLFALGLASLLGKGFAVADFWGRELALTPFVAVRPLTAGDLVFARFRVAAASALVASLLLLAGLGFCLGLGGSAAPGGGWPGLARGELAVLAVLSSVVLVILVCRQLIVSAWLGLYGQRDLFVGAVLVSFAVTFVAVPWAGGWFFWEIYRLMPVVDWRSIVAALAAAFVLKMAFGWFAWSRSVARGQVSARQLAGYWGCWLLATACLALWAHRVVSGYEWLRGVFALAAVLGLPLGRPGLAPLALAANRHRRSTAGAPGRRPHETTARGSPRGSGHSGLLLGLVTLSLVAAVLSFAATIWQDVPRKVDAGGFRLRLLSTGRGRPTVVLESDLRGTIERWAPVQNVLSADTRVVSYDRAGRGGSENGPTPRGARRAATELRTALRQAGLEPPFVLVGSRIGGSISRCFAGLYPAEVAALVLLDPEQGETSAEALDWLRRERAALMPQFQAKIQAAGMAEVRQFVIHELKRIEVEAADLSPAGQEQARSRAYQNVLEDAVYMKSYGYSRAAPGAKDEYRHFDDMIREDRAAWPPPPVPVVVLAGTRWGRIPTLEREPLDRSRVEAKLARQRQWVDQTPGAELIVTDRSGDDILTDAPDLIVQTVREVLRRLGSTGPRPARSARSG